MGISKKIWLGFGMLLVLLTAMAVIAYVGIGRIVNNAGEVIEGNKLRGETAQKLVDHLNWANDLSKQLNGVNTTEIKVQENDHLCAFGKFLYGDDRKRAEKLVPALKPLYTSIEEPHHSLHESAAEIRNNFKQADSELPGLLAQCIVDHLNWATKIRDTFIENRRKIKVQTDPNQCRFGKWLASKQAKQIYKLSRGKARSFWNDIFIVHKELHESVNKMIAVYKPLHPGVAELLLHRLLDHKNWSAKVAEEIMTGKINNNIESDPNRCKYGKLLGSGILKEVPAINKVLEASKNDHYRLHQSAAAIKEALLKNDKLKAQQIYCTQTLPALQKMDAYFQKAIAIEADNVNANRKARKIFENVTLKLLHKTVHDLDSLKAIAQNDLTGKTKANQIFAEKTMPALQTVQNALNKINETVAENVMTDKQMLNAASSTKLLTTILGIIAVVVGIVMAYTIITSISKVLRKIITSLTGNAEQVSSASQQISGSAQSLSSSTSQQAASIEEISSSLEEMSSMTSLNSDNAAKASDIANEAHHNAGQGANAMDDLVHTIDKIKDSSDKTVKILGNIDEIAFQTNLLALNAAVEAARAGESGKGFAVVAEEVRNLALRSAEAAKDTSHLIAESQESAQAGVEASRNVAEILKRIVEASEKLANIVNEVSGASREQNDGISQINAAVDQMNQVTQANSATSEESAAASEELSGQAFELRSLIGELAILVEGANAENQQSAKLMLRE